MTYEELDDKIKEIIDRTESEVEDLIDDYNDFQRDNSREGREADPYMVEKRDLWNNERPHTGFSHNDLSSSTGKPLGHQIAIHGILEVTEVGNTTSYAKVLMAYDEINLGALLTPYQEVVEPLTTNNSDNFLEGYIVSTKLDKIGVGITDIVFIDKGWEDGVHAGNVFEVYQIPEIEKKTWYQIGSIGLEKTLLLPDVLGELKIVKTEKRTATAVIVKNKYDIQVGYKIRSKR